ncbi:MAG: ISL3 family transposase [Planctomycetes bacterium]|nr:ISL3 family transposase [Planctomycetota bacterium]
MRALRAFFQSLLRLQGVIVLGARLDRDGDRVLIDVRRHGNAKPRCPRRDRVLGGRVMWTRHEWRHFDVVGVRCYLVADIREGRCPRHSRMVESVPWAHGRARHTRSFDRQVASFVQVADKTAAARTYDLAWRSVGRMVKRVVDAFLPKDLLDGLVAISVDETSYKRNHRYLTVVTDVVSGRVVWVGEGKSAETLGRFYAELGAERRERLEVVCMDMSDAYQTATEDWAPHADIVFDRFHVVKLLLKAVDEVRREECRNTGGIAGHPLKDVRFSLLRNPTHRTPKDQEAIARVERTNQRLFRAYQLRVSFEDLWMLSSEEEAREFLMSWTRSALLSRLQAMRGFAHTLRRHLKGILGFFRFGGLTNSLAEGINSKIQLAIHRARGFHSLPALVAMIHLCCSGVRLRLLGFRPRRGARVAPQQSRILRAGATTLHHTAPTALAVPAWAFGRKR